MDRDTVNRAVLENGNAIFSMFKASDQFKQIEYLAEGDDNYIFRIEGEQATYALRVLKPGNIRAKQDYDFEFVFQDYLRQHGIPTLKPYPCNNGQHYATFDPSGKQLQLTMHEFVTANTVTLPHIAHIQAVGTLLGKLHRLAPNCTIPFDRLEHVDTLSWLDDPSIKPAPNDKLGQKAYELYRKHAKHVTHGLPAFTRVPLHNDIHFGNLLFKDDYIAAVLDFDESHKHYIPLELGWSMGKICNFGDFENFKANLQAFRQSYIDEYGSGELFEVGGPIVMSTLIAEVSRKFLKNPTDPHERRRFQNTLQLVTSGDAEPAKAQALSFK